MKNCLQVSLIAFMLLLGSAYANSQSVEWKHYEYKDINLQFDLPADYEFEYPDDGSLSFSGHNNLTTFYLKRIDTEISTDEQRKEALYLHGSIARDTDEDPNFQSGVTVMGYLSAGTAIQVHELNESAVAMLLSDPTDSKLNFFIFVTYGGEDNEASPAYEQAGAILLKIGPIEK